MKRREYHALTTDVRRLRPILALALTVVVLLPSLDDMVIGGLARLAVSLAVVGALVWGVSALVLHYARIQVKSGRDQETGNA
jgi:hypothetical protein